MSKTKDGFETEAYRKLFEETHEKVEAALIALTTVEALGHTLLIYCDGEKKNMVFFEQFLEPYVLSAAKKFASGVDDDMAAQFGVSDKEALWPACIKSASSLLMTDLIVADGAISEHPLEALLKLPQEGDDTSLLEWQKGFVEMIPELLNKFNKNVSAYFMGALGYDEAYVAKGSSIFYLVEAHLKSKTHHGPLEKWLKPLVDTAINSQKMDERAKMPTGIKASGPANKLN